MKEIPVVLKGLKEPITYPGYRGGRYFIENLSFYGERVRMWDERALRDRWLAFDIERHVSWDKDLNLLPFTYSMMIDGFYPISKLSFLGRESIPTLEQFSEVASKLEGFILDETVTIENNGLHGYRNPKRNIFINWDISSPRKRKNRIMVGVIQEKPVSDLSEVLNIITPYAASIFNHLSPTLKISDEVIEESIRVAINSNQIIPQLREGIIR